MQQHAPIPSTHGVLDFYLPLPPPPPQDSIHCGGREASGGDERKVKEWEWRRRIGEKGREKTRRKVVSGVSGVCLFVCMCFCVLCVLKNQLSWLICQPAEHLAPAILDPILRGINSHQCFQLSPVTQQTTQRIPVDDCAVVRGRRREQGEEGEKGESKDRCNDGCPALLFLVTTSLCQDRVICALAAFLGSGSRFFGSLSRFEH